MQSLWLQLRLPLRVMLYDHSETATTLRTGQCKAARVESETQFAL